MRILSISSQVAYGLVGNSVAVPALQSKGHEVMSIPTIMLSNHPGMATPVGFRTSPEDLTRILERLEALDVLITCAAVMTGYFASAEQVAAVEPVLVRMKQRRPGLHILIDPVIGDDDALYVPETVAVAIKNRLLPLATCMTPNRFELEWLSGKVVRNETDAIAAAKSLGVAEVLATSIPSDNDHLATLLVRGDDCLRLATPKLADVPNGTGDLLGGLYLANRLSHPPEESFRETMSTMARAVTMSAGTPVLDVAGALHGPR